MLGSESVDCNAVMGNKYFLVMHNRQTLLRTTLANALHLVSKLLHAHGCTLFSFP